MARLLAAWLLSFWIALAVAAEGDPLPVPPLKARVTDLTASLSSAQASALEQKLAAFETRKGSQLVVLILPTTQPETIEQFGIRVMDAWKPGRKGVDDGVILLVAKNDRRLRIEVGYGLEGSLNDATAKRIISDTITPRFKAGDLPGGIDAGVEAILAVIDGESLPAPTDRGTAATPILSFSSIGENTFLIGIALLVIVGTILRYVIGSFLGSLINGGLAAGVGFLFTGTVSGALIGGAVGFFAALLGLDLILGALSGGRSGGGFGGGGGFSGGGGSGGGGGASGSW